MARGRNPVRLLQILGVHEVQYADHGFPLALRVRRLLARQHPQGVPSALCDQQGIRTSTLCLLVDTRAQPISLGRTSGSRDTYYFISLYQRPAAVHLKSWCTIAREVGLVGHPTFGAVRGNYLSLDWFRHVA